MNRDLSQPCEANRAVQDAVIARYHSDAAAALACERLVDIDGGLQEWHYCQVKMVERTIGRVQGTGGSAGGDNLRSTLFHPVFPDLWALRSEFRSLMGPGDMDSGRFLGHPRAMRPTRAFVLALVVALSAVGGVARAQSTAELAPITLPEIPNDVAVANDGTALVSLFNPQQVGVVKPDGSMALVDIGCSPSAVAITPDGSTGWSVCQESPLLMTINVETGEVALADVGGGGPVNIAYSASTQMLIIAGAAGQIVITSVTSLDDYQVIHDFSVGGTYSALALSSDGREGYVVTDRGAINAFSVESAALRTINLDMDIYSTAIAPSPSGRVLYVAGGDMSVSESSPPSVVLAVDATTGATLQEEKLALTLSSFGAISLAACHRALYVGAGIPVILGQEQTGVFEYALDAFGAMGTGSRVLTSDPTVSALSTSSDCTHGVVGSTNSELLRWTAQDPPYAPAMAVTGSLSAQGLRLSGVTHAIEARSSVSIYVKIIGKKGARFIKQATLTRVGADGRFTWKGAIKAQRISVYAQSGAIKSPVVTLTRR